MTVEWTVEAEAVSIAGVSTESGRDKNSIKAMDEKSAINVFVQR